MPYGKIQCWKLKGFGFIQVDFQDDLIFVHVSALGGRPQPPPGQWVSFRLGKDDKERPVAHDLVAEKCKQFPKCPNGQSCEYFHTHDPCLFLSRPGGCTKGDLCNYSHADSAGGAAAAAAAPPAGAAAAEGASPAAASSSEPAQQTNSVGQGRRYTYLYWDIENCRPWFPMGGPPSEATTNYHAGEVASAILNFFELDRGNIFVYFNSLKFEPHVGSSDWAKIKECLQKGGCSLRDVPSKAKDAADRKILADMAEAADMLGDRLSIILISGDGDFADTVDLLFRKGVDVQLVYAPGASKFGLTGNHKLRERTWQWDKLISEHLQLRPRTQRPAAGAGDKRHLCKNFPEGSCKFGDTCNFAHGCSELQAPSYANDKSKRIVCKFFEDGKCRNGWDCEFAHGKLDLRPQ